MSSLADALAKLQAALGIKGNGAGAAGQSVAPESAPATYTYSRKKESPLGGIIGTEDVTVTEPPLPLGLRPSQVPQASGYPPFDPFAATKRLDTSQGAAGVGFQGYMGTPTYPLGKGYQLQWDPGLAASGSPASLSRDAVTQLQSQDPSYGPQWRIGSAAPHTFESTMMKGLRGPFGQIGLMALTGGLGLGPTGQGALTPTTAAVLAAKYVGVPAAMGLLGQSSPAGSVPAGQTPAGVLPQNLGALLGTGGTSAVSPRLTQALAGLQGAIAKMRAARTAPSMQSGGVVPHTGTYTLHEGELVVPRTLSPEVDAAIRDFENAESHWRFNYTPRIAPFNQGQWPTDEEIALRRQMIGEMMRRMKRENPALYERLPLLHDYAK